jgi:hypothetical protein
VRPLHWHGFGSGLQLRCCCWPVNFQPLPLAQYDVAALVNVIRGLSWALLGMHWEVSDEQHKPILHRHYGASLRILTSVCLSFSMSCRPDAGQLHDELCKELEYEAQMVRGWACQCRALQCWATCRVRTPPLQVMPALCEPKQDVGILAAVEQTRPPTQETWSSFDPASDKRFTPLGMWVNRLSRTGDAE